MTMSEVSICNMALGHLGQSIRIASLTESSTAARACLQWYETSRDECLRDFPWPFAVTTADMALVADYSDADDPLYNANAEWRFGYAYPADALKLLRAPYGSTRNASGETATKFRIVRRVGGQRLLLADQDSGTVEYIAQITDPNEFPPDFVVALSFLIASRIAAQVTAENGETRTITLYALYEKAIAKAKMNAAGEQVDELAPDVGLITARE